MFQPAMLDYWSVIDYLPTVNQSFGKTPNPCWSKYMTALSLIKFAHTWCNQQLDPDEQNTSLATSQAEMVFRKSRFLFNISGPKYSTQWRGWKVCNTESLRKWPTSSPLDEDMVFFSKHPSPLGFNQMEAQKNSTKRKYIYHTWILYGSCLFFLLNPI